MVVGRVKPHTTFRAPYESGLAKMIAIGLGKQAGADLCHATGPANMSSGIEELARHTLEAANTLFGVAILEKAYDETCKIEAIPAAGSMATYAGGPL